MIKGKVGRTGSGFRSIAVHAAEGKEFAGVDAESGVETVTDTIILSGHNVGIKPKDWPIASPQVHRIKISDIERWLKPAGESDELIVGEGVVVELGEDSHICGPNGGLLYERPVPAAN